jgi:hypothetical protein
MNNKHTFARLINHKTFLFRTLEDSSVTDMRRVDVFPHQHAFEG